jgi:phosphoesterase RecJ-like protein
MCDPVPRNLKFLPGVEKIRPAVTLNDDDFEQAIVVDCGSFNRIGDDAYERFNGRFVINIDHHMDNPRYGNLHFVNEYPSTTMMVDVLLQEIGVPLDEELATCLYTGLLTDTNAFRNSNVNVAAMEAAARWVKAGANPHYISQQIYEQQSWAEMQLMGYALSQAKRENDVVSCAIPLGIFDELNVHPNDSDAVMGQLRSIEGSQVAVLIKEIDSDKVKVSFRSKSDIAVNEMARHFGGGGHAKAAGCLIEGKLDDVVEQVLSYVREQLAAFSAS